MFLFLFGKQKRKSQKHYININNKKMQNQIPDFPTTTSWIFMEMILELEDVEMARKASIMAAKLVLKELDEHFQGFASEDRVVRWKSILNELPEFGLKKD